jgi:Ca2+-binding RTX toxin-like protein
VAGDVVSMGAGSLVGGNDIISLVNTNASTVAGDIIAMNGVNGHGGNDTISIGWNQINVTPVGPFTVAGDFNSVGSGNFIGGNDSIALNLSLGVDVPATVSGDGFTFNGNGSFTGGNDTIVLNSNRTGGVANNLAGDAFSVNTTGTFHGGNDNITGSNGSDIIYGDAATITAGVHIGGDDIINGRGGNDIIDGGLGFDAAVYSSLNQAIYVNLNGIPGTGANPVEAIGQGSDQLLGIERVIGSQLGDVIIGNGLANVFDGLGGNDNLNGGGGIDSLRGGLGNDYLTGGAHADFFVFATAPNTTTNRDVITDFNHAADTIQLDNAIFAALGAAGALNPGFFRAGAAAADANDHIIYNQANGALYYDANGNGAGGSVMFAVLATKPAILANDFVVI